MGLTCADWLGFTGSFGGAFLAGIIAFLIMKKTNEANKKLQEEQAKDRFCVEISDLIGDYIATSEGIYRNCIAVNGKKQIWKLGAHYIHGAFVKWRASNEMESYKLDVAEIEMFKIYHKLKIRLGNIAEAKDLMEQLHILRKMTMDMSIKKKISNDFKLVRQEIVIKTYAFFEVYKQ